MTEWWSEAVNYRSNQGTGGRVRRLVLAAVLLAAGCASTPRSPAAQPTGTTAYPPSATTTAGCPLPEPRCPIPAYTPGQVISTEGVCSPRYNPRGELTARQKRALLAEYGIPAGTKVAEWDHYIARWAGGASTPENIWPQVNEADRARKERLEETLYAQVCKRHALPVQVAQARMREFWRWW